MNIQAKSPNLDLNRHDLVNFCKEKLVYAARDLAEFTKNGINAGFIVALAYKCDSLEASLERPKSTKQANDSAEVEQEIRAAVDQICETGRKIFHQESPKYRDYVISGLS